MKLGKWEARQECDSLENQGPQSSACLIMTGTISPWGGGRCNTKFLMLMDMFDGLNENLTWDIYYIARCMLNTRALGRKCL